MESSDNMHMHTACVILVLWTALLVVTLAAPLRSQDLILVVYKHEKVMEVWEDARDSARFVREYPVCAMSGTLGPKRTQGDAQVPEGMYRVIHFNPHSQFVLSFKIDYPNAADRILGMQPLGGDIFFHGSCVSAGCVSFTTPEIREIYPFVRRHRKTTVMIFPVRLHLYDYLYASNASNNALTAFWKSLQPLQQYWVDRKKLPAWRIRTDGHYELR